MPQKPLHARRSRESAHALQRLSLSGDLVFDRDAARAIDHAAIHEYGIPGMALMENAARGLADAVVRMLKESSTPANATAFIICGSGNNGGDGLALARHLHNRGINVTLTLLGEPDPKTDAGINRAICRKMNLPEIAIETLEHFVKRTPIGLIVDAIFGTGLDRPITGRAAEVINWINASGRPVLAADVPSGMDCNTGQTLGCAVRATHTVTFVGLKTGFVQPAAQELLGTVEIADIGAPIELLERFGKRVRIKGGEDAAR